VHAVDTLALSDFVLRNDAFVYHAETGVRGLFQGIGVRTTWQLHLPKRSNAFDYRRIFDVHLVLYYTAQFDAALRSQVLARPPAAGELSLLRDFSLRYDFPDGWYGFYGEGAAVFTLDRLHLPANQRDFTIEALHFRLIAKESVSNAGITVRVTSPSGTSGTATTDANGAVSTTDPALAAMVGASPIGNWKVEVLSGDPLMVDGQLRFDRIYSVQMGLQYAFRFVEEA
jgi:hypothetical protein